MRSVVVVFPASVRTLMPMLRYWSMGVERGTLGVRRSDVRDGLLSARAHSPSYDRRGSRLSDVLEPEVREGLVGFGHTVHFLALLHGAAAAFRSLQQLGGEPRTHRLLAAFARRLAQPAHRERHPPHRA